MSRRKWWTGEEWSLDEMSNPSAFLPLYHGTSSDRIKSIAKKGLCTPKSCRAKQVWSFEKEFLDCRKRGIYVSTERENAEDYAVVAADEAGTDPVVFIIDKWRKGCHLLEDPEVGMTQDAPPSYLITGCDCIRPSRHYKVKEK